MKKYDWYRGRRPQRTHFILRPFFFFFRFPLFPSSKYHFGFSHFLRTSKVTIFGNEVVYVCSVTQLCVSLCDPMDCSPPGSSVRGIFQARILEWVAISSPGDLPVPGVELRSPTLQADSLPSKLPGNPFFFSSIG